MALAGAHALAILERIGDDNRKREFYLTDAVEIARDMKLDAVAVEAEEDDVRGINTKSAARRSRSRAAAAAAQGGARGRRDHWSRRRRSFCPPTPSSARTSWSSPTSCSARR